MPLAKGVVFAGYTVIRLLGSGADADIALSGCQCRRSSLLSPTDTWARANAVAPEGAKQSTNAPAGGKHLGRCPRWGQ
jgi:hypothetical protein